MEDNNVMEWTETLERLTAAAERLEQAVERMAEKHAALAAEAQENVGRIVATVETAREAELARRLEAAEDKLAATKEKLAATEEKLAAAEARHASLHATAGRKTLSPAMTTLLAKQGVDSSAVAQGIEAGAIDGALASLSIEQRIAVKSELMRAGLLG